MQLPQDDFILLSYVNTKLRDEGLSFHELCEEEELPPEEIEARFKAAGYVYDEAQNRFRPLD